MFGLIRKHLPNTLTCLNFLCGVLAIYFLGRNGLDALPLVEVLLITAAVADFLDGLTARLLKSASAIGKDLDSLADAVTFGVLPSLVLSDCFRRLVPLPPGQDFLHFFPLITGVFSIIRLARFNQDTRQTDGFIGVPTPANAFFLIFLSDLLCLKTPDFTLNPVFFIFLSVLSAGLLISPFRLIALKFKSPGWKNNEARIGLCILSVASLGIFGKIAIPFLFVLYIIVSWFHYRAAHHENI